MLKSPWSMSIISGLATFIVLALIFQITRNVATQYMLLIHYINIPLVYPAIHLSIRHLYRRKTDPGYLQGLSAGVMAAFISGAALALYLIIYLSFVNPVMMQYVLKQGPMGEYMNAVEIGGIVVLEQI